MDKSGAGGKDYQDFPSRSFCLIVPEKFVGKSFSVSLIPISKKVRDKRRRAGLTSFCPSYFVSQYGNIS